MDKKYFCVISHTHWDREWYMPHELMRLRLIDMMDSCLNILETNPSYIFHLDAQTVVLEDYLEVRDGKRVELETFIKQGRLVVGPWYLQNDFYLTSGEATVRNLLEGRRIAESFGHCDNTGYAADQFGNISQLPQILHGFGIDDFVFGRGACLVEKDGGGNFKRLPFPSEFVWEGADGSHLLAVHMTYWYNNAQRFSENIDISLKLVTDMEKQFEGLTVTPYVLMMNGVDHLEAQENLLPILDKLNERLGPDKQIAQYKFCDYLRDVKEYIHENRPELYIHRGELRGGSDEELLKGTLSSRVYLKQSNDRMQDRLECCLEPLYSMLELSGAKGCYPSDTFRFMWKKLLKNHPHDSICGCSRDEVHQHMEDRFQRIDEISGEILRRGLDTAANHVVLYDKDSKNYAVLIANTLQQKRSGTVKVTLDFPASEAVEGFDILDENGEQADYRIISRKKDVRDMFSPINLPGQMDVDRYKIDLYVKEIPGMSFRGYTVKKSEAAEIPVCEPKADHTIENEYLRIRVLPDGKVTILDKTTGRLTADCVDWEETGDRGDSYIHMPCDESAIYGSDFPADVTITDNNGFFQSVMIRRVLRVPESYDFASRRRSGERTDCPVALTITLEKGSKTAKLSYTIENHAKDHRVRLLVRTGVKTDMIYADIPFDVICRKDSDHYFGTRSRVFPNTSFVAEENAAHGTAVLTLGQREYEHFMDSDTLAFTVLRGTGAIFRDGSSLKVGGGDQWVCPGNQCLRTLSGQFGIVYYTGTYLEAEIHLLAKAFRNPLISYFFSADPKKFSGGRPAVQGSGLSEIFYRPDPYQSSVIRSNHSFLDMDSTVQVSALKKAEDGNGLILRLVNVSDEKVKTRLDISGDLFLSDMKEDLVEKLSGKELEFNPKEIKTIRIRF